MENKLKFEIQTIDGGVLEQEIGCPPEQAEAAIKQMLAQYAQVGMLRKVGDQYTLLMANQIARVIVNVPSVIVSSVDEMKKSGIIL